MFSVQFEVHPRREQFDAYLGYAKLLKPELEENREQRFDLTEAGDGDTVVLIDAPRTEEVARDATPAQLSRWLGLGPDAHGLMFWDVYDAALNPGDLMLQTAWQDEAAAEVFEASVDLPDAGRLRRVRVVRDYGMYDRRETPQYHAEVR